MDRKAITGTVVALIVAILDCFKVFGLDFSIDNEIIYVVVSLAAGGWIWWKNHPTSSAGESAQKVLKAIQNADISPEMADFIVEEVLNDMGEPENPVEND